MIHQLKAVWQYRYFWASLVRLDLSNRYRRSVLGVGWSLAHPLAMAVVFCIVFGSLMSDRPGYWREYAPFLLAGLAVWQFVVGSASQGCESFIRAEAYIRQCPLPFCIYPLRTVLGTFIHFTISLAMVMIAVAVLSGDASNILTFPAAVPAILLTLTFCWSVATLTSFAQVFFHDTKHLIDVLAQLFVFLTPVMYSREVLDRQQLGWLVDLNPVNYFLELLRPTLIHGTLPAAEQYVQCGAVTAVSVGLACGAIAWLQRKVIFYL